MDEAAFNEQKEKIFLISPFGDILTHSDALLALLQVLPGVEYSALHGFLKMIPRFGRDGVYQYVAENRHSLFGKTSDDDDGENVNQENDGETCTLLTVRTPSIQAKFL